jgi:hypothetical protein
LARRSITKTNGGPIKGKIMKDNFSSNVIRPVDDVNRLDEEYGLWPDEIYARFTDTDTDKYMNDLEREYEHKRAQARTKQEEHYEYRNRREQRRRRHRKNRTETGPKTLLRRERNL